MTDGGGPPVEDGDSPSRDASGQPPDSALGRYVDAFRGAVVDPLFGDRIGLAVFLAALVVLGALWRVDLLLNDSTTVANLLVNVADGRLAVTEAPYSLTAGEQPGLVEVDGRLYGRNYGQVYLAVPLLWFLEAVAGLVDLRLLLGAGWSLAVLGLARTLAGLSDRPALADVGAVVALVAFGLSALVATRIDWVARPRPLVALGASTVLLAAVGAVVTYRLVSWAADRRVGVAAGLGLVAATPVGFWASFPKRHVLSTTLLLLACYLFAVGRTADGRRGMVARAGAYVPIAFLASVHAFEAAFALVVLAVVDVLTAASTDLRPLALIGAVVLVSLTPMVATNAAISGDPLESPRMLPDADGDLPLDPGGRPGGADATGGTDGGSTGTGGNSGGFGAGGPIGGPDASGGGGPAPDTPGGPVAVVLGPLFAIVGKLRYVAEYMHRTVVSGVAAFGEPDRVVAVFVRSGWISTVDYAKNGFEAIELALLEAFPLAGALAWVPVAVTARLRGGVDAVTGRLRAGLADPRRQTDLLAAGLAVTFLVIYLPFLPLQATITVRYVVPAVGLLLYGVARLAPVRAAFQDACGLLAGTYAVAVLAGAVGYGLVLVVLDPAQGEAVQLHAQVGLATAVVLAGASATWSRHRRSDVVAATIGVAAAVTTLFLIFAALWYFADGHHALDLVRRLAEGVGWHG